METKEDPPIVPLRPADEVIIDQLQIVIDQNARILKIMDAVSEALAQVQSHPMLGQFIGTPGR